MVINKHDMASLNRLNWENLIELYEDVSASTKSFNRKTEPVLSFFSRKYCWPNFSLIQYAGFNAEVFLPRLNRSIINREISPFVLLSPMIDNYEALSDLLDRYEIRQISQWPVIWYDLAEGLPPDTAASDFNVKNVKTEAQLNSWHEIASQVLFNNKKLPLDAFLSSNYILLLGYEQDIPVAATLIFLGSAAPSVHMVSVLPEYRRKGYGMSIFRQAIVMVGEMQYNVVFAQASPMGKKPWADLGFKTTGYLNNFWKIGVTTEELE